MQRGRGGRGGEEGGAERRSMGGEGETDNTALLWSQIP